MKNLLIALFFILSSCGKKVEKVVGPAGSSCTTTQTPLGASITCTDGTSSFINNGNDGVNGVNGEGCAVTSTANGALITCGATSTVVMNGTAGTLIEIVTPCPNSGAFNEVLLKLSTGELIAVFDGGPHLDRLVKLVPGTYGTTDGYSCQFTVNNDLTLN